ncbi:MAG: AraC family transcriptional regulator [Verrucomicrobia bacterium]|nr:AraC family transcriptional regulator [Verrucomicrobiota bacterium]
MNPETRDLLAYLSGQKLETFAVAGRIDGRRHLAREFPAELPLLISHQAYPTYRQMVGENWMHWQDYYELWVASGGHGEYRCGAHQFAFGPGDVVLIDPLKLHGVLRMEKAHAPLVLFFRAEAVAPTGAALDRAFLSAWDRRPEKILPRLAGDHAAAGPVHGAMLRLARAWFEPQASESRSLALKLHLMELLFHLRRAFAGGGEVAGETVTMRSDREARLRRVLEFVSQHCHESVAQPDVARVAGMSVGRFREFFKETTGWGFGDYLRDLRLERAARMLRETSKSVAIIAQINGFADQSHLQRLFKAKHGISPLAYRKHHLTEEPKAEPAGELFKK